MAGVGAVNDDILYLATATGSGLGQILKSVDGGVSFAVENTTGSLTKGLVFLSAAAATSEHAVVTGE